MLEPLCPSSNLYFYVDCCSPNIAGYSIFDLLSSSLEYLLIADPRSHVTISGYSTVHNRVWLVHPSSTSAMGREAEQFGLINYLPQLIYFLARTPIHLLSVHTRMTLSSLRFLHSSQIIISFLLLAHWTIVIISSVNFTIHIPPQNTHFVAQMVSATSQFPTLGNTVALL